MQVYLGDLLQMTRTTAGAVGITRLVGIDMLSAEQRTQLAAASREARPSEEYRIQFAALAQRRLELRQDEEKRYGRNWGHPG
jgi:hypothetical protein